MFASLQLPAYRWLWLSGASGNSGYWSFLMVAGWTALLLTHSGFWVGSVIFSGMGMVLFVSPYAGVLADRVDRRVLLTVCYLLCFAGTGGTAVLAVSGLLTLPWLLALTLVFGVGSAGQITASNTLVASVVPLERLLNAVSLLAVTRYGAQFLGPAIATVLLATFGLPAAIAFCAATFLLALLLTLPLGSVRAAGSAVRGSLWEGWRYTAGSPGLFALIVLTAFHCTLTMTYMGALPVFVSMDLGAGDALYGSLVAAVGLAAIVGSLGLAAIQSARVRTSLLLFTALASGGSLFLLGVSRGPLLAVAAALMIGASQTMFMSLAQSLIQLAADDQYRGRVTSIFSLISGAPMAVGAWIAGGMADWVGPGMVLTAGGLLFAALVAGLAAARQAPFGPRLATSPQAGSTGRTP